MSNTNNEHVEIEIKTIIPLKSAPKKMQNLGIYSIVIY